MLLYTQLMWEFSKEKEAALLLLKKFTAGFVITEAPKPSELYELYAALNAPLRLTECFGLAG